MPPVLLSPFENIVGVGWGGSGAYVYVETMANYFKGAVGSRIATLQLDRDDSGKIIGQKNFHDKPGGFSKFRGMLFFKAMPKSVEPRAHWLLKLVGSIKVKDQGGNPSGAFCGLITTHYAESPIICRKYPWSGDVTYFFYNWTSSRSDPNGVTVASGEAGPLADMRVEDCGKGGGSRSTEDRSIWYEDPPGSKHYVNSYRPCSELPQDGQMKPETTEGFSYITIEVYPRLSKVLPVDKWTMNVNNNQSASDIISSGEGGPRWHLDIGPINIGKPGGEPKYDDLPSGDYTFRNGQFEFSNLPKPKPKELFRQLGAFPLTPTTIKYTYRVTTLKPFTPHAANLPRDGQPAGQRPSIDQTFTPP